MASQRRGRKCVLRSSLHIYYLPWRIRMNRKHATRLFIAAALLIVAALTFLPATEAKRGSTPSLRKTNFNENGQGQEPAQVDKSTSAKRETGNAATNQDPDLEDADDP